MKNILEKENKKLTIKWFINNFIILKDYLNAISLFLAILNVVARYSIDFKSLTKDKHRMIVFIVHIN